MKDPVLFCEVYKQVGCAHVDGYLCNYETCDMRKDFNKQYSEKYDAYYDEETGEWLEKKCSDPACEYCANRPDKATDE